MGIPRRRTAGARAAVLVIALCLVAAVAQADWPTYRHDNARSGVTPEPLPGELGEAWAHTPRYRPQPAWQGPARTDGWHKSDPLKPRMIFDWAFHVVMDEQCAYFGSSADDKIYCIELATGAERWSFFTEGPVRLAPTLMDGKLYVGSDDGYVYCLDAATGTLLWKFQGVPNTYRLPGNARMMSLAPVRTGVLVDGDTAYFCSGLFSFEGGQVCALNAADGQVRWQKKTNQALQGYLLASKDRLYAPRGRSNPAVFDREDGKLVKLLEGGGGSFAVLVEDYLFYGPGKTGQIEAASTATNEQIVTFEGNALVVNGGIAYMQSDREIAAMDRTRYLDLASQRKALEDEMESLQDKLGELEKAARAQSDAQLDADVTDMVRQLEDRRARIAELSAQMGSCMLWTKPSAHPYSLIMAGDRLFAGGTGDVAAIDPKTGDTTWTAPVNGRALEMAISGGRLLVSTDEGTIHCFTEK